VLIDRLALVLRKLLVLRFVISPVEITGGMPTAVVAVDTDGVCCYRCHCPFTVVAVRDERAIGWLCERCFYILQPAVKRNRWEEKIA
jgi:hypothetical protein